MVKMCRTLNIPFDVVSFDETERVQVDRIAQQLQTNQYTHVAIVHCETSSGILNPIDDIGQLVYKHGSQPGSTVFIVDSMSAFGAIPVDLRRDHISYLISSANKCIEGIPGFAFVIGKKEHLLTCQGQARSLALDLYDQYTYMQQSKQFRFTRKFIIGIVCGKRIIWIFIDLAPTHAILAFKRALDELDEEGGIQGRAKRFAIDTFNKDRCIILSHCI